MSLSRRDFIAASTLATAGMPAFLQRIARAAPRADQPGSKQSVLVVVQLTGGNDGLNTVIPYSDPAYRSARPNLALGTDSLLNIDDELALHPALKGFADLLEDGRLAIIQGVGYPNPNRSHFVSMDIWHKATPSVREAYGWIGRTTPLLGDEGGAIHVGQGDGPLALFGSEGHAPTLESIDDYRLRVSSGDDDHLKRQAVRELAGERDDQSNPLLSLVRSTARTTYASAEQIQAAASQYDTPVSYPQTPLGRRLKLVAQFIDAGLPERVYYVTLDGFDTHARQAPTHARLLETLADAVKAFQEDITHHGHAQRVLTMTFSEFGRRVKENGSQGTDHGAASQMFFVGESVQAGPVGNHPSLTDLDRGDLQHHTDFRQLYATVLDQWLGVDPAKVLADSFEPVQLFDRPV